MVYVPHQPTSTTNTTFFNYAGNAKCAKERLARLEAALKIHVPGSFCKAVNPIGWVMVVHPACDTSTVRNLRIEDFRPPQAMNPSQVPYRYRFYLSGRGQFLDEGWDGTPTFLINRADNVMKEVARQSPGLVYTIVNSYVTGNVHASFVVVSANKPDLAPLCAFLSPILSKEEIVANAGNAAQVAARKATKKASKPQRAAATAVAAGTMPAGTAAATAAAAIELAATTVPATTDAEAAPTAHATSTSSAVPTDAAAAQATTTSPAVPAAATAAPSAPATTTSSDAPASDSSTMPVATAAPVGVTPPAAVSPPAVPVAPDVAAGVPDLDPDAMDHSSSETPSEMSQYRAEFMAELRDAEQFNSSEGEWASSSEDEEEFLAPPLPSALDVPQPYIKNIAEMILSEAREPLSSSRRKRGELLVVPFYTHGDPAAFVTSFRDTFSLVVFINATGKVSELIKSLHIEAFQFVALPDFQMGPNIIRPVLSQSPCPPTPLMFLL